MGDDEGALADCRLALSIADDFDTPAPPGRLELLQTTAALHCRRGETVAARQIPELATASLGANNPNHGSWLATVRGQRVSCPGLSS